MLQNQIAKLNDHCLLQNLKNLVEKEREHLVQILHHLREVERRKLFCDLKYKSLFEYAVNELKYSEGQAGRRIQAMRLLKELPQIEAKIKNGALSLSNISQAQSYFREAQKVNVPFEKMGVLDSMENKSAREGQKILAELCVQTGLATKLPKEKERVVSPTQIEIQFVVDQSLKNRLEEYRSLLGPIGSRMSFAELIGSMAENAIASLKIKKFGKKRMHTPTSELERAHKNVPSRRKNSRYISKNLKFQIWTRDEGRCTNCKSQMNVQLDHITPVAHGGTTSKENLRLLCHNCNQRAGVKLGLICSKGSV